MRQQMLPPPVMPQLQQGAERGGIFSAPGLPETFESSGRTIPSNSPASFVLSESTLGQPVVTRLNMQPQMITSPISGFGLALARSDMSPRRITPQSGGFYPSGIFSPGPSGFISVPDMGQGQTVTAGRTEVIGRRGPMSGCGCR